METNCFMPGSTIGMLGGGQLGRMTMLAGRAMGYRFAVYDPDASSSPGAPVADHVFNADFADEEHLARFADCVDVVTLEFENIPVSAIEFLSRIKPVLPSGGILSICQNRRREKEFLRQSGVPCADFDIVDSFEALKAATERLGYPCVLKTADFGYDGKGQYKLNSAVDIEPAWTSMDHHLGVVEQWIQFEGEYSIICARNASGTVATYPVIENIHRNHILYCSKCPADVSEVQADEAKALAIEIAEKLDLVGLVTVELFLTENGWKVNELAPRPHNSGHLTIEACNVSQFEQHVRSVCNLPLGQTAPHSPGVMINLLGDVWSGGEPHWAELWKHPNAKLHLYGKEEARVGRKMGHFTVISSDSVQSALEVARAIKNSLS